MGGVTENHFKFEVWAMVRIFAMRRRESERDSSLVSERLCVAEHLETAEQHCMTMQMKTDDLVH
jgi:hypothetical protein